MALTADSKNLYIPLSTIYGNKNKDGSYTLSALDIKNLNDNLYAIARKIQGGLTFADLTEAAGANITDLNGNVAQLELTATGLTTRVANAEGAATTAQQTADGAMITAQNAAGQAASVAVTVNGLGVTTAGGTTYITGDHVKSGTLEGVTLESDNGSTNVTIQGGEIGIKPSGASFHFGKIYYDSGEGKIVIDGLYSPLKIRTADNLSIGSIGGTVYVGADAAGTGDVYIGKANGGRIDIYGDLYINGVAYVG